MYVALMMLDVDYGSVPSTVATAALVPKHRDISQCSQKSSDTSDISDGQAQMSDEKCHKFENDI